MKRRLLKKWAAIKGTFFGSSGETEVRVDGERSRHNHYLRGVGNSVPMGNFSVIKSGEVDLSIPAKTRMVGYSGKIFLPNAEYV